jgi:hypothetical protein
MLLLNTAMAACMALHDQLQHTNPRRTCVGAAVMCFFLHQQHLAGFQPLHLPGLQTTRHNKGQQQTMCLN